MAAVAVCGQKLEYVPEAVINRDICRAALQSPNTEENIKQIVYELYPELKSETIIKGETVHHKEIKMKF